MTLDTAFISRIQFAFTVSFHILFPAFSIGLATFLAIMESIWLKTRNPHYLLICKFWTKVFALTFGMGIVSGIVMEFQFGTNWSGFTKEVGPVLGSLFTYEVMTAFFIEAGFLGVMLFGWNKVGAKLHYTATLLVWVGVTLSAFWILSANSWMQYPAGVTFDGGRFVVTSWYHVVFNPTVIMRYLHMMLAAWLAASLVVGGVAAFYLLKQRHTNFSKSCLSFATAAIIILIPLQLIIGDEVGLNVHTYQPIKTAAMEGVWQTQKGAPLLLFALPDMNKQKNLFALGIPHFASVINTHKWDGELVGLKSVPSQDRPYVPIVFFSFRIMVGVGIIILLLGLIGLYLRWRKRLYDRRWYLILCGLCSPLCFIAILTGWFTAETGRQPWIVYNLLRTSDAASPVTVWHVILSLALLIIVYGIIFGIFYFRYLGKILRTGPDAIESLSQQPFNYMQAVTKEGG